MSQVFADMSLLVTLGFPFFHVFLARKKTAHFRMKAGKFQRWFAVAFIFSFPVTFTCCRRNTTDDRGGNC